MIAPGAARKPAPATAGRLQRPTLGGCAVWVIPKGGAVAAAVSNAVRTDRTDPFTSSESQPVGQYPAGCLAIWRSHGATRLVTAADSEFQFDAFLSPSAKHKPIVPPLAERMRSNKHFPLQPLALSLQPFPFGALPHPNEIAVDEFPKQMSGLPRFFKSAQHQRRFAALAVLSSLE